MEPEEPQPRAEEPAEEGVEEVPPEMPWGSLTRQERRQRRDETKRTKTHRFTIILFSALILFLLAFAICIFLFLMFFAYDVPVGMFLPLDEKIVLNFTEADEYCRAKYPPNGKLLVIENKFDEERFIKQFMDQPEEFHVTCPKTFIGHRIRILEKMSTAKSGHLILPVEFYPPEVLQKQPDIPKGTMCIGVNYSEALNTLEMKEVHCLGGTFSCVLCEVTPKAWYSIATQKTSRCPEEDPVCYNVWGVRNVVYSFDLLPSLCKERKGRIAIIGSDGLTNFQRSRLTTSLCSMKYIGMLKTISPVILETSTGKRIKYQSEGTEPGMGVYNCIVITKDNEYPFKYEKCFEKNCFVCQITKSFE